MKLPLPPNFFKCPPLTVDEQERLKQQAYATAMDVVQKSLVQTNDAVKWTLISNESALKIYRGEDSRDALDHLKLSVGVAEVAGSIDEVVELFRNDTTEHTKEYVSRFGRGLLDSANLYTLVEPSDDHVNESVTINWMALKSPLKKVILERDCCYLEGHYEFEINGKRGWVRSLKSLNLMCCPDMQHALGLVRMIQMGTGHVFMEADRPGYMRIAYVVHADFRGSAPDWAIDVAIKRRCKSLLDIDTFLRENRLAQGHFLSGDQLVPKDMRRQCFLCQKKFGVFTTKSNCCKCGEVFCGSCNHSWTVKVCGIPTRIEACTKCALVTPTQSRALLSDNFGSEAQSLSLHSNLSGSIGEVQITSRAKQAPRSVDYEASLSGATTRTNQTSSFDSEYQYQQQQIYTRSQHTASVGSSSSSSTARGLPLDTERLNEKWIQELIACNSLLAVEDAKHVPAMVKLSPKQLEPIRRKKTVGGRGPEDEHEPGSHGAIARWGY